MSTCVCVQTDLSLFMTLLMERERFNTGFRSTTLENIRIKTVSDQDRSVSVQRGCFPDGR